MHQNNIVGKTLGADHNFSECDSNYCSV